MKHLSDYILETKSLSVVPILEDNEGNIILEGFWKKLGKWLGFSTEKVQQTMKGWDKELRAAYLAGQIAAAKLNDNKTKEAIKKQDAAAEKSTKDLLTQTKLEVQRLMKNWDAIKMVDYVFAQYKQLYLLSEQEKDDEGKTLSEKFKKLIDDKFPDGGKQYEQTVKKIEQSGVDDVENKGEDEKPKEPKPEEATIETIKDNADVLTPIVKTLGGKVYGNKLKDTVTKLLSKTQKTSPMKLKQNNILGMSVMICGALMMSSDKGLKAVCNELETDAKAFTDAIKPDEIKTGDKK